ncbi:PREDICTED: subtilisin-like protease SBT4.3 [Camelina sativa]|uniref:Subtilisin-like protease SBT4.3 n=1 Tax=Camelina sativa TaxID=90675 RepID=A0ABM0WWU1_CAMSA|nr:PREDICTED: subtilisin-like protease SBT4.3 [Camelina sativa]
MAKLSTSLLLIYVAFMFTTNVSANDNRQVYIVYMGALPEYGYSPPSDHLSILQKLVGTNAASSLLITSYKRSFNGFAAKLSQAESQKLQSMKEVVSVFPSRSHQLTTTRSWDFVGFGETAKRENVKESDVIVGVIDSGIWPESESFDDKGFGPPPKKWKGSCKGGLNFTCNNKLIGARFYNKFSLSARDDEGHGTHTASIAAGNAVQGASFYGLAQGTARGGVPSARIAAYKVCLKGPARCSDVNILAAFDDAIADGVDVISISISTDYVSNLLNTSVAIGSFHAMFKGIITAGSAGNNGPEQGSVANVSPWMITVAASATDRRFVDRVVLGNGKALTGLSVNPFSLSGTKFPIVYGQNVSKNCSQDQAGYCLEGCVDRDLVKGKIVLCDDFLGNKEAHLAGATGAIVLNTLYLDIAFVLPLPASSLSLKDYESIKSYIQSTEHPQAEILRTEEIVDREAPYVPSFSSRGPSFTIQNLLKPDVSAPGLEILAAFSPVASPSDIMYPEDTRSVRYSVMSGTSMACPHVAGVAAYVKSFRPDWSPSAIKSAIMTTATTMNLKKNPDQEFAYGSGQINPTKASDPGLVYEIETEDYLKMLCSEGFDSRSLTKISRQNITCSERTQVKDLNYPTMTTYVPPLHPFNITFRRTVTNVGLPNSTYKASIVPLRQEILINIEPETLSFGFLNEKKSFVVTISGEKLKDGSFVSSSLVWSDGSHSVRSPIVAYSIQP